MLSQSNVPSEEWKLHPQAVHIIWEIFGRAEVDLVKRQHSLPNLFFKERGCIGPRLAQPPPVCFSPNRSDPSGNQMSQGTQTQGPSGGPALDEPALGLRAVSAADSSPMSHSPEARPSLSGDQDDLAPPARAVGSAPLGSRRESADPPESVLNTISQARAPSTRRLYALIWSVFSTWCATRGEDPALCDISVKLSFLQELLDKFKFKLSFIVIPLHVGIYSGTKCRASQVPGAT